MRLARWSRAVVPLTFVSAVAWAAEQREPNGAQDPTKPAVVTIPLGVQHDAIGLSVTPGGRPATQLLLEFADGAKKLLTLDVRPQTGKRRVAQPADAPQNAKPAYHEVQAEDSFVAVSGTNLRIFARPNLFRYTDPQQDELLSRWDSLPSASQTFVCTTNSATGPTASKCGSTAATRGSSPPRAVCGRSKLPCHRERRSGIRLPIDGRRWRTSIARWRSAGLRSRAQCARRRSRWPRACGWLRAVR